MIKFGRKLYRNEAELFDALVDTDIWVKVRGYDTHYYFEPCRCPMDASMKAYHFVPATLIDSYNEIGFRNYYFDNRAYATDTCLEVINDIFDHRTVVSDWRGYKVVDPLEIRTTEEIQAALKPYAYLSFTEDDANTYFNGYDTELYDNEDI